MISSVPKQESSSYFLPIIILIFFVLIIVGIILLCYFEGWFPNTDSSTTTSDTTTTSPPVIIQTPPTTIVVPPPTITNAMFKDNFTDFRNWNLINSGSGDLDNEAQYYVPQNVQSNANGGASLLVNPIVNSSGNNTNALAAYRFNSPNGTIYQRYYFGAKITTQNNFAFQYGRVDVVAQLPDTTQPFICPSISLCQANQSQSSEYSQIDIMNVFGTVNGPNTIFASLWYTPDATTYSRLFSSPYNLSTTRKPHTFSIVWKPGMIQWYYDQTLYATATPTNVPKGWNFDRNQNFYYISIKNGIGGTYSCPPNTNVPPLDQPNPTNINPLAPNYLNQPVSSLTIQSIIVSQLASE